MSIIVDFVRKLELKRCSKQTIASYKSHLLMMQSHFNDKSFKSITDKDLFEGKKGGKYSSESASQLFKRAAKKANSKKACDLTYP